LKSEPLGLEPVGAKWIGVKPSQAQRLGEDPFERIDSRSQRSTKRRKQGPEERSAENRYDKNIQTFKVSNAPGTAPNMARIMRYAESLVKAGNNDFTQS
jgi:hypothetical protein